MVKGERGERRQHYHQVCALTYTNKHKQWLVNYLKAAACSALADVFLFDNLKKLIDFREICGISGIWITVNKC